MKKIILTFVLSAICSVAFCQRYINSNHIGVEGGNYGKGWKIGVSYEHLFKNNHSIIVGLNHNSRKVKDTPIKQNEEILQIGYKYSVGYRKIIPYIGLSPYVGYKHLNSEEENIKITSTKEAVTYGFVSHIGLEIPFKRVGFKGEFTPYYNLSDKKYNSNFTIGVKIYL